MVPLSSSFSPEFASVLGAQRAEPSGPGIHPLERALVGVTAAHLCFLPWALGAMHPWAQVTSLGLSLAGFAFVVLPRPKAGASRSGRAPRTSPAAALFCFPVFWAGLALLAFIALQGLNPSWRFVSDDDSWWLVPVAHVSWLPSGVDAPYARSNPWRALTILGSAWLLACSVWAGFSSRRSYRALLYCVALNAFLLAVLGILEQLIATKRIFWTYLPNSTAFIASFIYRNHAGSYFNLAAALSLGLAWWHYRRALRRVETLSLAVICAFVAAFCAIMVIFSYSRMSIILLLALTALVGCAMAIRLARRMTLGRDRSEIVPMLIAVASFLSISLITVRSDSVWSRFAGMVADPWASDSDRSVARQAAAEMFDARPFLGWGAGCFRYGFPIFAQKHPEIYGETDGPRKYWEHAHDDLLEFPIELGIVGMLPVAGILVYGAFQLVRFKFWQNAISLSLVLGCALTLVHSWVDFVFQNPAVLLTWCIFLVGAARLAELDQPGRQQGA